jgi:hypothetical protein
VTHPEEIIRAVALLVDAQGCGVFTRNQVRKLIGVSSHCWLNGYAATFQGMRVDHPGGAPVVGARWKDVFRRVRYGEYVLTSRGQELLREL